MKHEASSRPMNWISDVAGPSTKQNVDWYTRKSCIHYHQLVPHNSYTSYRFHHLCGAKCDVTLKYWTICMGGWNMISGFEPDIVWFDCRYMPSMDVNGALIGNHDASMQFVHRHQLGMPQTQRLQRCRLQGLTWLQKPNRTVQYKASAIQEVHNQKAKAAKTEPFYWLGVHTPHQNAPSGKQVLCENNWWLFILICS